MALSDKWTQAQLTSAVRRELADPTARWWSDAELNGYVAEWQRTLQNEFEFVKGTATVTTSTSTLTLSTVDSNMLRVDAIYCNARRMVARDKEELDGLHPGWRNVTAGIPVVAYQDDFHTVSFWPPNGTTTRTFVFEHPVTVSFAASTSTMALPAWTKYNVVPYGAWQAYGRYGPNYDANRAARHKARWRRGLGRLRTIWANHFPDNFMSIRPGGKYEADILDPILNANITEVTVPGPISRPQEINEVPSGTVNGTNATFTLSQNPDPDISLSVFVDGIRYTQTTHYTLSGTTITFVTAYIPITGQLVFCRYLYDN